MRHVSGELESYTERDDQLTAQKLYAANGTEIALISEVELILLLADYEVTAAVVVSEEVDDLILGIDWLDRHRCR